MNYIWRIKKRLPERYGKLCNILVRGKMNSCLLEFEDGFKVVTSRNFIRKIQPDRLNNDNSTKQVEINDY
jgi:hypothetical protein